MIGYLMNFFKYGAADEEDYEQGDTMYQNAHGGEHFVRSVVWSVFDRLEIRDISRFQQYRLSQFSEKRWVGERQFILLYEINSDDKHLEYRKSDDKCRFAFHKVYDRNIPLKEQEKDETKFRFFGISMVDLAPEMHFDFFTTSSPGKNLYDAVYNILNNLKSKNQIKSDMICYEVYGTLGGNDLVIIWLANEYKDVITMIEAMRKSKIKNTERSIIANIYTIMGLRDINNPKISYKSIDGNFNIRLTKKGTYQHEAFAKALNDFIQFDGEDNKFIETTLGEHDICIHANGEDLAKKLYDNKGLIRIGNDVFFDSIIQANTELSVHIDYDDIQSEIYKLKYGSDFHRCIISYEDKERVYADIECITQSKLFKELPYLKETMWILYEDYLKNISSAFSYPWIGDLHYQFSQSVFYLKNLVDVSDNTISKNYKFKIIRGFTTTVRQTMLHISQANRLFFEIPSTHLRNTGSYSKVLRTYYGIVKKLLLQAYLIPKVEKQASIVPFITFDVIPKIESTSLPQLDNVDVIIVNIVLPYEALVEIPKYAKLLAHEVFHYIAPRNREERNIQVGIISISTFFSQILKKYLRHILGEDNKEQEFITLIESIDSKIERKCLEYVVNQYEKLTSNMKELKNSVWNSYFDCLDSYYSRISMSFASKYEIHKEMFMVFINIINDEYKSKLLEHYAIEKERFENIEEAEFCGWIKDGAYRNITDLNRDVKYALREAMADYFMIQVMDESNRIQDYYYLNLKYKNLLESKEGGLDIGQKLRIGIITDLLFGEIVDEVNAFNEEEIFDKKLFNELKNTAKLSQEQAGEVILCFTDYYHSLYQYRGIIKLYLGSLQFNDINDNQFKRNLNKVLELLNVGDDDDFFKSVQYIERFQVQDGLNKLNSNSGYTRVTQKDIYARIRESLNIQSTHFKISKDEDLCAYSVSDIIKKIEIAINKITDEDTFEQIWFRGHSSHNYKLIPSLYRLKEGKFYKNITLREVINPLFKSFKVKAFGAKEIYEGGDSSRIGILASMQHYSVPTNILDWSPAAFVALYFAVEKYMAYDEKTKKKREPPKEDAELWILNPGRLNHARGVLTKRMIDSSVNEMYPIPSIYDDEEDYKEYIPFATREKPLYNLPVAVYVPYINQRIKAQLGTFTMFSLDAEGEPSDDDESVCFEDMLKLQDRYYKKAEEYKPFLASVRISKKCIFEVADWLRSIGITKPTVYPELDNISGVLTGEIKDYCERKEGKSSKFM